MKLFQIVFGNEPVSEDPESGLANSLMKGLGPTHFAMPALVNPGSPKPEEEPLRKAATPRKRRNRKFFRTQEPKPGV